MTLENFNSISRVLLGLACCAMLTQGCFLKPKKKSGNKTGSSGINLVDKSSIFMDRIGDGDTALVQFKTVRPAKCELEYYSQDAKSEPKKEAPGKIPCVNPEGGKSEFAEKIPTLKTDNLYFVVLIVYESTAENSQRLTIRETSNSDTVITTDDVGDIKLSSLSVARLNIPLKVAEFHRQNFDAAKNISEVKNSLASTEGCKAGVPAEPGPFSVANISLPIANLATRDFAAGTAGKHPQYPDRLQITYSGVNELLDKWTLIYTENAKDHIVIARPISRIINLEMQSTTSMAFESPQLSEAADPLKIDAKKVLKFSWTVGSALLESTLINIQIGRADNPKSIYCSFLASKRTADVSPDLLASLEDGRHVVLVEMVSNQLWLKDSWLITSFDWRSGRIEK